MKKAIVAVICGVVLVIGSFWLSTYIWYSLMPNSTWYGLPLGATIIIGGVTMLVGGFALLTYGLDEIDTYLRRRTP